MTRIAVIGGGPGGLITAYLLERKYKNSCQTTLFEAADRVGGKILTRKFDCASAIYEAGVAEVYDYGIIGPDPLQQLISELGLKTTQIDGQAVVLKGKVLRNEHEIGKYYGEAALKAVEDFRRQAAAMMPIEAWSEGFWQNDNEHPWARRTCEEILNEVVDLTAREYLQVAVHSDLATEPHLTSGLNGLKNFVMDVPGYVRQSSIEGGMEMFPKALQKRLVETHVKLNSPVVRVEKKNNGYSVSFRRGRKIEQQDFDAVFIALPHNWLTSIEWGAERLRRAMTEHIAYYDRPAHYLRVTILFKKPFWRNLITGSWFMLDAFGGCCVYDEGARHQEVGEYGVLGWLLAGSVALSLVNLDNQTLIERALESLPDELYKQAREHFIEGKVHRWAAAVNALPGGLPARDTRLAHLPEPAEHPGLFIVGDYLFDSTLNGVFDSANVATDLLHSHLPSLTGDTVASRPVLREQHATGCSIPMPVINEGAMLTESFTFPPLN